MQVPQGEIRAADCHAHVFCGADYPFSAQTVYVLEASQRGSSNSFLAVLDAHGLTHGLLVGAQPYGRDNRCLLNAITAAGGRLKGIALVSPGISDRDLAMLADRGVVGIRMNLSTYGLTELIEPGADRLLARIKEMGWFLQIHCEKDELVEAREQRRELQLRVFELRTKQWEQLDWYDEVRDVAQQHQ